MSSWHQTFKPSSRLRLLRCVALKVYLVRNGETLFDIRGNYRILGHLDVPLTEEGQQQAESIGKALSFAQIDRIYHCGLRRSKETAEKIGDYQPEASLAETPLLSDIGFGEWEGKVLQEVLTDGSVRQQWQSRPSQVCVPGGEALTQVSERLQQVVDQLQEEFYDCVCLVTHAIPAQLLLCGLFGLELDHFTRFRIDLASITQLSLNGPDFCLIKLNDRHHLEVGPDDLY